MKGHTPRYAVVACADEKMVPAACCALLSAKRKTTAQNVTYFLVGVDVGEQCIGKVGSFAAGHGIAIDFRLHTSNRFGDKQFGRFGLASTARLSLGEIVPPDYCRVLYIDADLLVCDDILQLFEMDLCGRSLGAVENISLIHDDRRRKATLGMADHHAFFNSGVLLFDWPQTLAEGSLAKARKWLDESQLPHVIDQSALNATVRGNFFLLPQRWNTKPVLFGIVKDIGIVHFVGKYKPWHGKCPLQFYKYRRIYKAYLEETAFDGFVERASLPTRIGLLVREVLRFLKEKRLRPRVLELYDGSEAKRRSLSEAGASERSTAGP